METVKPKPRKASGNQPGQAFPAVSPAPFAEPAEPRNDPAPGFPPLPDSIVSQSHLPAELLQLLSPDVSTTDLPQLTPLPFRFYSLNVGSYLVRFDPTGTSYHYDGTIRVSRQGLNTTASGDLYYHKPLIVWPFPIPVPPIISPQQDISSLLGEPNPANGIPKFARSRYRYYLRITELLEGISPAKTFTMRYEMWKFNGVSATPMWTNEGTFSAEMTFGSAPASYPSGADYLTGKVKNSAGTIVGNLTMGQVSKYLREATVEIDSVSGSEAPVDSGVGHTWQSVFDSVGWKINVVSSNNNVVEPSGNSWSDGEMHAAMLARRDSSDLDSEWRYHILAVKNIDSTPRGIMYDAFGTDSNNIPREGIGIASHWVIPNANPWGKTKGLRFGTAKAPYFRTALHEIGHAMGLYHNTVDFGIMNTTDVIAAGAVAPVQFPDNIKWLHAPDDQKRLRHMPDMFVRPGGIPFGGSYSTQPISPDDEHVDAVGLALQVTPLNDVLPIGAPARFEISLTNQSDLLLPAPASLQMKSGFVSGRVTDPSGTVRSFSSIVICVEEVPLSYMQPGDVRTESLTLLRGGDGALFPIAGAYTVDVDVTWDLNGGHVGVTGSTNVYVTGAQTDSHARAALKILSTPDTLLSLAITGDHLVEGNEAIQAALADKTLNPHFAYVEAKRLAQPFAQREANLDAAAALLTSKTVMSSSEIRKCAKLIGKTKQTTSKQAKSKIVDVLAMKAKESANADSLGETLTKL
jgi:predicted Zn-dependent protease